MSKLLVITLLSSLSFVLYGSEAKSSKVAVIKMLRGKVEIISQEGDSAPGKKGLWVTEGSIVKTAAKSFVRLSFIDKSTVNVGPKSEMKIEKFSKDDAGVLNVISGKIRSKVTKDYLQINKNKSKLYVKSKQAVMGVRGTDFVFSYSPKTGASTAVLFEGSIVFNKFNKNNRKLSLESIVNKGRSLRPGQFSVARRDMRKPTVAAKLSSTQLRAMNKNENFVTSSKSNKKVKSTRSIVPPGLDGAVVYAGQGALENGIKSVVKTNVETKKKEMTKKEIEKTKGFVKGDDIQPAAGSLVHIDTGTIIPVAMDATFSDGEWVSKSIGGVDKSGDYVPPSGYSITDEGKLIKVVDGGMIQQVLIEVKPVDEVPTFGDTKVIDFQEPINGPAPAGDGLEPIPPKDTEILAPPPICTGCTYIPPSYNTNNPNDGIIQNVPKTPVKINVQQAPGS